VGPDDLPHFAVAAVHSSYCTGRFDSSPWVGENWIAALYLGSGRFLWGRLRDIDMATRTCSFYPMRGEELSMLHPGGSYALISGAWAEQSELVLDEARHWQRTRFAPSDMVRYRPKDGGWMATPLSPEAPPGGDVIPGGWDHEHCEICWKRIGLGGEPDGFFSPPDSWVCEECYTTFIVPQSLAFVTWSAG
jgi:hypothetical protein